MREAVEYVSQHFRLSEEEKRELLEGGRQAIIDNRTSWARIYLEKAGLLESTKKAHFRITSRGLEVLKQNPSETSMKYLYDFPIDRSNNSQNLQSLKLYEIGLYGRRLYASLQMQKNNLGRKKRYS